MQNYTSLTDTKTGKARSVKGRGVIRRDFQRNCRLYLLMLPVLAFYIIFHYAPMAGAIVAFKNYSPALGIFGSPWTGLTHFKDFFSSYYFVRIMRNTLLLSTYTILFCFPAPIILALMLNELRSKAFLKVTQTIVYLPRFISIIVICSLIKSFTYSDGIINDFLVIFTGQRIPLLQEPKYFRTVYVLSEIWQTMGWDSIIYMAALAGVDQELYDAASVDGAGKWRQLWCVTLPSILPTIMVLLIIKIGSMMNLGYEKVILLYNEVTYETADIISSFIYRKGLQEFSWSYSTAVGLFNSVCSFVLLFAANAASRRFAESSLW